MAYNVAVHFRVIKRPGAEQQVLSHCLDLCDLCQYLTGIDMGEGLSLQGICVAIPAWIRNWPESHLD